MREVTCLGIATPIATPSTDACWIVLTGISACIDLSRTDRARWIALTGISACVDLSKVGSRIGVRGCPRDRAAYAGDWSA